MKTSALDMIKWGVVTLIIAGIVLGNAYFGSTALSIRVSVMIIAGIVALLIAVTTAKGKIAFGFVKESRAELRKVVWPTRQETVQTTLMIAGIVALVSLILWAFDSFFAYIISSVLI